VRIIAGKFGGLRLAARVPASARPTADRVREALCSALAARGAFEGAAVLDLFAGTGALGLEALSRGAISLVSVDHDKAALRCIEDNARGLRVEAQVTRVRADLLKNPDHAVAALQEKSLGPFSLVFADPPYVASAAVPELCRVLADRNLLSSGALLALEHPSGSQLPAPEGFIDIAHYRYGDTAITLLAWP
jgi:16S rRNA (guanine966-N2)-methyltransferase